MIDNHDAYVSTEPTAQERAAAHTLWGLFVALVQAGFSDAQALHIVTATVTQAVADTTGLHE